MDKSSLGVVRPKQGDPKLCRCGRTEFFPANCPCQKQEKKS